MPKSSTSTSHKILIGLAGTFASGKDSLAHYLERKYSIMHISTGDIVRKFSIEKYESIERPQLYKAANWLRDRHGSGALSHLALQEFELHQSEYKGVCISGLRAWGEAEVIKSKGGIIFFTDAPVEVRYQRTIQRARDNEKYNSIEEFKARERRESGEANPEYNLMEIKKKADIVIDNDKNLQGFLDEAVAKLKESNTL